MSRFMVSVQIPDVRAADYLEVIESVSLERARKFVILQARAEMNKKIPQIWIKPVVDDLPLGKVYPLKGQIYPPEWRASCFDISSINDWMRVQ